MVNRLSKCCGGCKAVVSTPCPTFGEILEAQSRLLFQGWGYDERGFVKCPTCLQSPPETKPAPTPAPPAQGSLF